MLVIMRSSAIAGSVESEGYGIAVEGDNARIINSGVIDAAYGVNAYNSSNATISNSGTINGSQYGIIVGSTVSVNNSGTVSGSVGIFDA